MLLYIIIRQNITKDKGGAINMLKFIICGIILGILLKMLSTVLNNLADAIEKKEKQRREELRQQRQDELRQKEIKEQEELVEALRQQEKISYMNLYKNANNLKGSCFYFTAIIVQKLAENIYHVVKFQYENQYQWHQRIQISIIGTPREALKKGDIIFFKGEVLGYCSCIGFLGENLTYPWLKVYVESIIVKGYKTLE